MKIFVLCDLEGAAGVVDFESQSYQGGRLSGQAIRLATLELNSLINGALEGGASNIVVLDGHGSGGIDIEYLHEKAKVILGHPLVAPWGLDAGDYQALFLYGHHAMEGTRKGVLCHSWSSRTIANCWLNGKLMGEIGFNIALAGEFGIPVVFISGDRSAIDEARIYLPNIHGVVVKEGLGRTSALSLTPSAARKRIQEGARQAMDLIEQAIPYKTQSPYTFDTEYLSATTAESKILNPAVERLDMHTVRITGETLVTIARNR